MRRLEFFVALHNIRSQALYLSHRQILYRQILHIASIVLVSASGMAWNHDWFVPSLTRTQAMLVFAGPIAVEIVAIAIVTAVEGTVVVGIAVVGIAAAGTVVAAGNR